MHARSIKGQSPVRLALVPWLGARRRRSRPSPSGVGAGRERDSCSACRTRRSSAPGGRGRTLLAARGDPVLRRARSRSSRRCCRREPRVFAAALFAITLVLRVVAERRPRRRRTRLDALAVRRPPRRGQERVPAVAARRSTTARASCSTASPSWCRRCPCTAPATRPGCCWSMHYLGLDTSPRLAAFCIVVGALSAPLTYVLAKRALRRAASRGSPGVLAAFSPAMLHFGATSRRRGLPHARPARRDPAAVAARTVARRARARRRLAVRLVAARDRRLGGDPRPRPRRPQARDQARRADRRRPARLPRAVRARHRLRPDRHAARHAAGLRRRDRVAAARTRTGCSAPPRRSC